MRYLLATVAAAAAAVCSGAANAAWQAAARKMIADIDAGNARAALQNARAGASQQSSSN